jgi:hypothetical protein
MGAVVKRIFERAPDKELVYAAIATIRVTSNAIYVHRFKV